MDLQAQDTYRAGGALSCAKYEEPLPDTDSNQIKYLHLSDQISIPHINTCGGTVFCMSGMQDSLDLGLKLEERLHNIYLQTKLSIAVSGCGNRCTRMCINDIGIIGKKDGWDMIVGGSDCHEPGQPWELASDLSVPQVLEMVDRIVALFKVNQRDKKKLSVLIEGIGFENFKEKVISQENQGDRQSCKDT